MSGDPESWTTLCDFDDLVPDRGVTALIGGRHVAVFRLTGTDELRAIDNVDPFSGASVLSRGVVGAAVLDGRREPYVASPLRKQRFSLVDGACLEHPEVRLRTFDVRLRAGIVEVADAP